MANDLPEESNVPTHLSELFSAEREIFEQHKAHRVWVLGQVATLLSFYWQADDSDLVKAAAGKVWADLLERFSQDEIAAACRRWISNETRRPTPAEIIKLCVEERPRPRVVRLPYEPITPEMDEERRALRAEECKRIDALLVEKGFGQIVRRMERSGEE